MLIANNFMSCSCPVRYYQNVYGIFHADTCHFYYVRSVELVLGDYHLAQEVGPFEEMVHCAGCLRYRFDLTVEPALKATCFNSSHVFHVFFCISKRWLFKSGLTVVSVDDNVTASVGISPNLETAVILTVENDLTLSNKTLKLSHLRRIFSVQTFKLT